MNTTVINTIDEAIYWTKVAEYADNSGLVVDLHVGVEYSIHYIQDFNVFFIAKDLFSIEAVSYNFEELLDLYSYFLKQEEHNQLAAMFNSWAA